MKSHIEKLDDNKNKLILYNDLAIQNADEFKKILKESLEISDTLIIDAEYVASIDLSCLQLLCAVHKSAIKSGKTVIMEHNYSSVITETLFKAGYVRHAGCAGNEKCFWAEVSHG